MDYPLYRIPLSKIQLSHRRKSQHSSHLRFLLAPKLCCRISNPSPNRLQRLSMINWNSRASMVMGCSHLSSHLNSMNSRSRGMSKSYSNLNQGLVEGHQSLMESRRALSQFNPNRVVGQPECRTKESFMMHRLANMSIQLSDQSTFHVWFELIASYWVGGGCWDIV